MITEYQTTVNAIERAVNKNSNSVLKVLIKKFARALWLNYLNEKNHIFQVTSWSAMLLHYLK